MAAYYGPNPPVEAVPNIKAAVLGIYGWNDKRIAHARGSLEEALKKAGKSFEIQVFDGADHAFFNDTGARFNPTAAKEAWVLTLDFLRSTMSSGYSAISPACALSAASCSSTSV